MAAPAYQLEGNFESLIGSSMGYVRLTLEGYGAQLPRVSGTGVFAPPSYTSSVGLSFAVTVYGNDVISPGSTYYKISVFNADGTPSFLNAEYQLTGSGTFDLSTLTPLGAVPPPLPIPTTVNANTYLAGPSAGSSGAPVYRHGVPNDVAGVDTIAWVGGDTPQRVSGTFDIGKEINAAYASLPATGGLIYICPQTPDPILGNLPYNFSTPIVFGTAGKWASLKGIAPASQSGTLINQRGGTTLNFTPTTSGTSFTLTQAVLVPQFTLTAAATASGGNTVYTGTITNGANGAFTNARFTVAGFVTHTGNNGTFVCVGSTPTTITLANASGVAESQSSTATPTQVVTQYLGTITGGASGAFSGQVANITGFTSAPPNMSGIANNGYFSVLMSTAASLLVWNSNGVNETQTGTATLCLTAIKLAYDIESGDFQPGGFIQDVTITNNYDTMVNYGAAAGSTIGIDFTRAGRLNMQNVFIGGFGVNTLFNAWNSDSNFWGANWYNTEIAYGNVGLMTVIGMENFNWWGGAMIVNNIGYVGAGGVIGGTLHFHGISFDSNILPIRDLNGNNQLTFNACHFENNALTTPSGVEYIHTQSSNVQVFGGFLLDDDSASAPRFWMSVGYENAPPQLAFASLTVVGLNYFPTRAPSIAGFIGGSAVFVQGVNGNFAVTNLVSGPAAQTINLSQANQATPTIQLGPVTVIGEDPGGDPDQLRVGGIIRTSQGIRQASTLVLTTSFQSVGLSAFGSMLLIRDTTSGGIAIITTDPAGVAIVGGVGTVSFVTGAPSGNQIQVQYDTGTDNIQLKGSSTTNGHTVSYMQLFVQS